MISVLCAVLWAYLFINTQGTFFSIIYGLLFVLNAVAAAQWIGSL